MKRMLIIIAVSLLAVAVVLGAFWWFLFYMNGASGRLPLADTVPSCNANITDIRVTAIPRTQRWIDVDGPCYQIAYGYEVDGQWCDIPAENYPVCCLECDSYASCDYLHSAKSHVVKIGPFLLVCIVADDDNGTPYDTIGTAPLTPLTHLFEHQDTKLTLLLENYQQVRSWFLTEVHLSTTDNRYYFILDANTLPDDYELCYTKISRKFFDSEEVFEEEHKITKAELIRCTEEPSDFVNPDTGKEPTLLPDFSVDAIESIRVTVKRHEFAAESILWERYGEKLAEMTIYQVYYDFKVGGVWYSYPAEYYDLKGIQDKLYDSPTASTNHVVQIGDFVLICIEDNSPAYNFVIRDTLGTEAFYPLLEDEVALTPENKYSKGMYYENPEAVLVEAEDSGEIHYPMKSRGYLIVPVHSIGLDYRITYGYDCELTGESSWETLDGDTILGLLEQDD